MKNKGEKKKWLYYSLGIIQLIIAIGAIPAGLGYITDPSGKAMGTTTEMLSHSPLADFLIPGLFLFIIHGLGNVAAAVFSFIKKHAAGYLGVFFGGAQVIWIIVQVSWIGLSSFMQPLFLVIGGAELILGYMIIRQRKNLKTA